VQSWQSFFRDGGDDEGDAIQSIETSLLAIKIIRRLIIAGYDFPGREKDVQEFWTMSRNHFGEFFQYVASDESPLAPSVQKLVEKHLMQLSKLHLNMATTHPAAFVLLPNSLDLVRDYWSLVSKLGDTWGSKSIEGATIGTDGDAEDETPILERLGLKGLLIRACVKMVFYPAQSFRYKQQQEKDERTQATDAIKSQLLTDDLVREMISALVTRFFVFRPSDLRMWEEEPDEWEKQEEGGDDWEFAIRPCAEKLFLDLAKNFKELIIQPLLQVFYTVASESLPSNTAYSANMQQHRTTKMFFSKTLYIVPSASLLTSSTTRSTLTLSSRILWCPKQENKSQATTSSADVSQSSSRNG
jgi:hypothetical protein